MQILITDDQKECIINCKKLEAQIKKILISLKCKEKEISILLADDTKMRALNKQYRDEDCSTDVLSFPQNDCEEEVLSSHLLGDVVISTATAKRQSIKHKLSLDEEIALLIIHGILHLLGYDHENSNEEAIHMKKKTRELFGLIYPNKNFAESCGF